MNTLGRAGRLALMIAAVVHPMRAERPRTDVIVMKNGDRFTGEIKGLQHGELSFKAAYMVESVRLDWSRVERVESDNLFIVALVDGRRYAGRIEDIAGRPGEDLQIIADNENVNVSQSQVIEIKQREASFLKQLQGSINYGFTFTGDNNQITSSLAATAGYNGPMNSVQLTSSSQLTSQSQGPNTNRINFTGEFFRKLTQNWFYSWFFDALKSDQQELNLRTTYGAGLGRRLVQTDRTSIQLLGGFVYTHENYFPQTGEQPIRNNVESNIGFRASTFRFRTLDLSTQAFVYPSLTDAGRVRLSTQSNAQIEFIRDFFWDFNLYENFDSRPPINAPRNDVGVTTGLGWKF